MENVMRSNIHEGVNAVAIGTASLRTGRILSGLAAAFLLMDGVMKLFKPEFVIKPTIELGYSESVIVPLGILLTVITVTYLITRTAVLGAILLTGYLGGAVATHVRVGGDTFSVIFPVILGAIVWIGLYLHDGRLREMFSSRK